MKARFVLMLRWLIVCFSGLILVGVISIWRGPAKLTNKVAKIKEDEGINTRITDISNLTSTDTPLKESVREQNFDPSMHASIMEMLFSA